MKEQHNPWTNIIGLLYFALGLAIWICRAFAPSVVFTPGMEALILIVVGAVFIFGLGDDFLKIAFDKVKGWLGINVNPEKSLTVESPFTNWIGGLLSIFSIALFTCRAFAPDWIYLSYTEIVGFALSGAFLLFGMSDQFFTAIFQKIRSFSIKK